MNHEKEEAHLKEAIDQLCKLTEALSIHQRHLYVKIEEMSADRAQFHTHLDRIYSQIDALFSIHAVINIRHPLPTMRGWPVSPDFVKLLMSVILDKKPQTIVETGSGVSSVVAGYCLEINGRGTLVSYDHDEQYAGVSSKNIESHGLEKVVTVVHAPLRDIKVSDDAFIWYDPKCITIQSKIDLLVIDGPPGHVQRMARYPALPFFFDRLSDHAIVLLDDASRKDEKIIVEKWLKEYGCFECEYVDTETGAAILRRM